MAQLAGMPRRDTIMPTPSGSLNGALVTGERYYKLYDDHHEPTIVIGRCAPRRGNARRRTFCGRPAGLPANEVRLYHVDGTLSTPSRSSRHRARGGGSTASTSSAARRSPDHLLAWSVGNKRRLSSCVPDDGTSWEDVSAHRDAHAGSCGARAKVRLLLNGTQENAFKLHGCTVTASSRSLNGTRPAGRQTVKLFNVNDGAVVRTFTHHTGPVYSLALMPDGRRFISGSYDRTARIVEIGRAM